MNFSELLRIKNACTPARVWAGDLTIEEVIINCHRGDWLLWLAERIGIDRKPLVLTKGYCANTVRHLMRDKYSIEAVDAAIAYGKGEVSELGLRIANQKAAVAHYEASLGFDDSVYSCTGRYNAATAYAAQAAVSASGYDTNYSTVAHATANASGAEDDVDYIKNQLATANIVREHIGELIVQKVNTWLTLPTWNQ